jgi:hypothetical protein
VTQPETFDGFDDAVLACADLVGRAGASEFEIGYTGDETDPRWYAHAKYRGARLQVQDHRDPTGAAMALAARLMRGATCRCRRPVALSDGAKGCRWRLVGQRWEPGCDAPPLKVDGPRGDLEAMRRAMGMSR